jgi:hypothetical protein
MSYTRHTACLFRPKKAIKMKRLYQKLTGETLEEMESSPSLTGLLAAFLSGVLCCMTLHWLLF